MTTEEGNKLIAEFMHVTINDKAQQVLADCIAKDYFSDTLKYHTSWEELMQVIDKIETMNHIDKECTWNKDKYRFTLHTTYAYWGYGMFRIGALHRGENRLDAAYNSVIAFIQWYNQTKQQ